MEPETVYHYTLVIAGVGVAIKSLETLALRREYQARGVFDYTIVGNDALAGSPFAPLFTRLYSWKGVATLSIVGVITFSGLMVSDPGTAAYTVAATLMIASSIAIYYRQAFGLDGADQMTFLVLITTLFCFIVSSVAAIRAIGIWFIALQLALAYFVSGAAKLVSKEWRSGTAISGILSTYTYGTGLTRKLFTRNSWLCVALCWSVIVVEMLLPFGLFLEPVGVAATLGVAFAMHVSIAVVMGLNDFVWAFAAAFPSFYYVGTWLSLG